MADAAVAQFTEITGASAHVASRYLQLADNNLESAMQLYFEGGGNDLQIPDEPEPAPAPPTSSGPPRRSVREDDQGVVHVDDSDDEDAGDIPVGAAQQSAASQGAPGSTFNDDLAMAQKLQEEMYAEGGSGAAAGATEATGATGATGASGQADDDVRAPLERTTETLVGPNAEYGFGGGMDPAMMHQMQNMRNMQNRGSRANRAGIFDQRDVSTIWNEADENAHRRRLAQATGGASESSSKSNMLAEMYRPPFEIMSRLSWDAARDEGRESEKWLLVNIQDPSVFDCQLLNRDLWKNPGVKDTVKEHFVFLQYSKDDPRGAPYIQYYFPGHDAMANYPHIAIVDPRTGEQMKVWSGPPVVKAPDFIMQLHEFLDRYSLKHNVRNPIAKRKPDVQPHTKMDTMSEEEMMEMAMRNSLEGGGDGGGGPGGEQGLKHQDPDELTRGSGDVKGKGKAPAANGHQEEEGGAEEEAELSPFHSIPSDKPHVEPEADPATTTRIQFRHPSGRVIHRFALSDPVQRLYEWLKASPLEGKEGVDFELVSMGQNLIGLLDTSVQDAGLKNGTVMVGFLED